MADERTNRPDDKQRAEEQRGKSDEERRKADEKKKAASQQALEPNAEGNVIVECIMGPYRGQHITMSAADGQTAINDHWARDPRQVEYEHEPLDDEDRQHALDASHAWAQTQWDAAQGVDEPPPPEGGEGETGGVTRRRAMHPNQPAQGYTTRQAEPGQQPQPPQQPPRKP